MYPENTLTSFEIVIVENVSKDGSVEWLRNQDDIVLIENEINSGFPGGCNQGIRKSNKNNEIFLLKRYLIEAKVKENAS